jgi:hypothetical protein
MFEFRFKTFILLTLLVGISACGLCTKEQAKTVAPKQYVGWWIYGEGRFNNDWCNGTGKRFESFYW